MAGAFAACAWLAAPACAPGGGESNEPGAAGAGAMAAAGAGGAGGAAGGTGGGSGAGTPDGAGAGTGAAGGTGGAAGAGGGAGGSPPDAGPDVSTDGADAPPPVPTFGTTCEGGKATLAGKVWAPNGVDPLPGVFVYAAKKVNPFPAANYCQKCAFPIDTTWAFATSADDGSFTLDLAATPYGPTIDLVVNIGRFRKVTKLPVACGAGAAPKAATTLPGKSSEGDMPKIAVATGNVDHLDQILKALGIQEYDCYDGRATPGSASATCAPVATLAALLTDKVSGKSLAGYHMLFSSCAPGSYKKYQTSGVDMAKLVANVQSFVTTGGRFFATDMSYDFVEQTFPDAAVFMGPGGTPQPVEGANVGVAGSYPGKVALAPLLAWLKAIGAVTGPDVTFSGFLNPWSVIGSLPASTSLVADGTVQYKNAQNQTVSGVVPLTCELDVASCGRIVYSSYHTATGNVDPSALKPQERILEYLIFDVAKCL